MTSTLLRNTIPFAAVRAAFLLDAIKEKHKTMTRFARTLGVTQAAVSGVIRGHWRSARIEKALADLAGIPAEILFPGKQKEEAA